ncbi:unnamed protein product, partial [Adineta steineri]
GIDCGGKSPNKCAQGIGCKVTADCDKALCTNGLCAAPTCTDGIKNGAETNIDCGAGTCPGCATSVACTDKSQCASGVCDGSSKTCADSSYNDGVLNGDETGIDCGGKSPNKCAQGIGCKVTADCDKALCTNGLCAAPTCTDGIMNNGETYIDCGGLNCLPCASGKGCTDKAQCASGVCDGTSKTCADPSYSDQVLNGDETGIDCGGTSPNKCAQGIGCKVTADCDKALCTNGLCAAATCSDGIKNGVETDVDCGGSKCSPCDANKICSGNGDCASKNCVSLKCAAIATPTGPYSFWPMENNALDIISGLSGTGVNSPTYVTPGITGTGYALKLIRSSNQYINIPTYKSFASTSFTVEMWIYPTTLGGGANYGLFGQYEATSTDHDLLLAIIGATFRFSFYGDDANSGTTLSANTWYHVACVYDYSSRTQIIYINGVQDISHTSAGPYLGASGSIYIGNYYDGSNNYRFDGYIDQVTLYMNARSASDILSDATLTTWHSFDYEITYDSGPLKLLGTAVSVTLAAGKVSQALQFSSSSSYYQISGYVLLGVAGRSYSMSLWVQPTSTGGGTLVHYSSQTDGKGTCYDLIGFSSTGQIIATALGPSNVVTGSILSVNTWTHIATTYSQANGLKLYVNGASIGAGTGALVNTASSPVVFLTLGSSLSATGCQSRTITPGTFSGYLDEFRVYSRELSATEVFALANP